MLKKLTTFPALALIRLYQVVLSPMKIAFTGNANCCRFYPSCSHYAAGAYRSHGFFKGTILTAIRLVKCQPLHSGGVDEVPNQFKIKSLIKNG